MHVGAGRRVTFSMWYEGETGLQRYIRHRLNGYLNQRVPRLFLVSSCAMHDHVQGERIWHLQIKQLNMDCVQRARLIYDDSGKLAGSGVTPLCCSIA